MSQAGENSVVAHVRSLRPDEVEEVLVLRIGDALMANDDSCIVFFMGRQALVVSPESCAVVAVNPALMEGLIEAGRVHELGLAAAPPLVRPRHWLDLVFRRRSPIISGLYRAEALRAQLPREGRRPVRALGEIIDVG